MTRFYDLSEPGQTLDPNSGTARLSESRRKLGERFAKILAEANAEREPLTTCAPDPLKHLEPLLKKRRVG
jgi:hypothetical protein